MEILKATLEDVNDIHLLDSKYLGEGWTRKAIKDVTQNDKDIKIYIIKDNTIRAYIFFRIIDDEMELLRIAVKENNRRKKLATKLLNYIIDNFNIQRVFLEVRQSNLEAINFYKKQGFKEIHIRKDFYKNPIEDAIFMKLDKKEQ